MIAKLRLKNFRAIEDGEITLAPLTILTGANNSGKSTVSYALLTLKNVVSNPNTTLDSLFSFGFINLSGFKENVSLKEDDRRQISIEIEGETANEGAEIHSKYGVVLGRQSSSFYVESLKPTPISLKLDVTFPYPANLNTGIALGEEFGGAKVSWNGLNPTVSFEEHTGSNDRIQRDVSASLFFLVEDIKRVDFVALRRGFSIPIYTPQPVSPQLVREEEVATLLSGDRDLEGKISFYLEKIVGRNFDVRAILTTSNFQLQTMDRETGLICDLVNEGFGTNQLVWLLAKALRRDQQIICIEEAEIHLHPSAIINLVDVLVQIAEEGGKKFLISTHSEHFVISLLNRISQKRMPASAVKFYFMRKERRKTVIEEQRVNDEGQIEGGLKGFYDTELTQLRDFLSVHHED